MEPRPRGFVDRLKQYKDIPRLLWTRAKIDAVLRQGLSYDAFARIPGIDIVERAENRPPGEKCSGYVFGENQSVDEVLDRVLAGYERGFGHPGDIALYITKNKLLHMGRVVENGRVRSKWGGGHVFEHEPLFVPSDYGNTIYYAREKREPKITVIIYQRPR